MLKKQAQAAAVAQQPQPEEPLSGIEQQRADSIARNSAMLAGLRLLPAPGRAAATPRAAAGKLPRRSGSGGVDVAVARAVAMPARHANGRFMPGGAVARAAAKLPPAGVMDCSAGAAARGMQLPAGAGLDAGACANFGLPAGSALGLRMAGAAAVGDTAAAQPKKKQRSKLEWNRKRKQADADAAVTVAAAAALAPVPVV